MSWAGNAAVVAEKMIGEYPLKPMRAHVRTYKNSFIAREGTYWLIKQGVCRDEADACEAAAAMLAEGLISNVSRKGKSTFENNKDIYRFCNVDGKTRRRGSSTTMDSPSQTGMVSNPMRKESFSISTPDGDDVLFKADGVVDWKRMGEADVTRLVLNEMQLGATTINLMREKLCIKLTEDGFSHWKPLVKQLIDKYGGQVQQLLTRMDQQELELRNLNKVYDDNNVKLSKFSEVSLALAQRLNNALEVASMWDVPPATYAHLHEDLARRNRDHDGFWDGVYESEGRPVEETTPHEESKIKLLQIVDEDVDEDGDTVSPLPVGKTGMGVPKARQDSGFKRTQRRKEPGMTLSAFSEVEEEEEEEQDVNASEA